MAITVEINGKTYTFRNLEEQVLFLTKELTKVQQSLGNALPDPIEGPEGPEGPTGATGPQGERGTGVFGCSAVLPSATGYKDGDFYVLFNGNLYKKVTGNWVLQTNLKGPQGPVGLEGGSKVVANPVGAVTDNLNKIDIDGTIYNLTYVEKYIGSDNPYTFTGLEAVTINGNNYFVGGSWAKYLSGSLYFDSDTNKVNCDDDISFNEDVYLTGNKTIHGGAGIDNEVEISGNYYLSGNISLDDIHQLRDEDNEPIIICENLTDQNSNYRFIEGNITTSTITGVTFSYAKWSLSGSHLMIVLAGTIAEDTQLSFATWGVLSGLPNYIKNKIVPLFTDIVEWKFTGLYKTNWESIDIGFVLVSNSSGVSIVETSGDLVTFDGHFRIQFDLLIDLA